MTHALYDGVSEEVLLYFTFININNLLIIICFAFLRLPRTILVWL